MATNLSKDSAQYLLEVTEGLSIKVDHPHAIPAMQIAVKARKELREIVNSKPSKTKKETTDE